MRGATGNGSTFSRTITCPSDQTHTTSSGMRWNGYLTDSWKRARGLVRLSRFNWGRGKRGFQAGVCVGGVCVWGVVVSSLGVIGRDDGRYGCRTAVSGNGKNWIYNTTVDIFLRENNSRALLTVAIGHTQTVFFFFYHFDKTTNNNAFSRSTINNILHDVASKRRFLPRGRPYRRTSY